jgi:hypothetical protein
MYLGLLLKSQENITNYELLRILFDEILEDAGLMEKYYKIAKISEIK